CSLTSASSSTSFSLHLPLFFSTNRPPPTSTLFPYTTLFRTLRRRSRRVEGARSAPAGTRSRPRRGLRTRRRGAVTVRVLAALLVLTVQSSGPNVDVSNLPGAQSETAITIDPTNDRALLAGSNSFPEGTMRAYGSTDGGETWQGTTVFPAPKHEGDTCAADPGVGIDRTGRQYYSFIRSSPCQTGHPRLYVASRLGSDTPWGTPVLVAPLRGARFDDKPAIAVDRAASSPYANRVYAAW